MRKSVNRRGRRRANALRRTPRHDDIERPLPAHAGHQRQLLERILDEPHLAHVVPRLHPEMLHRIIQTCGLEDCAELVALATPGQLQRVFDLDLWRAARPGLDEQLDPDRFGMWLEVLMDSGAAVAAEKLAGMDVDLVIAALAQQVLVFDAAAVSPFTTMDGQQMPGSRRLDSGCNCEIAGYLVVARRTGSWDAVIALLLFLDAEHHDYFNRLMRGCCRFSSSTPEDDGLNELLSDSEQDLYDRASDREGRRDKQGYVSPAQARAFLQTARQLQPGCGTAAPRNPVAGAYFRAMEWASPADEAHESDATTPSGSPPASTGGADPIAALVDVLLDAGVMAPKARALLEVPHGHATRLARIQAQLQFVGDYNAGTCAARTQEFAYLANTLAAGCSIQERPFTAREASDAILAVCNLGLEQWPAEWLAKKARPAASVHDAGPALPEDFLVDHDLISVFEVGWTALHRHVSMYAAERLIQILTGLRNDDRTIQAGLDALRLELERHWRAGAPWRARDALDVIVLLDQPAWAALLGLIGECPVMHAGIAASRGSRRPHAVSASAFEFISERSQIAAVREFMETLAETLRG